MICAMSRRLRVEERLHQFIILNIDKSEGKGQILQMYSNVWIATNESLLKKQQKFISFIKVIG